MLNNKLIRWYTGGMGVVARVRDKILLARAECWLMLGLFFVDVGASLPFGVSSPDPNTALTPVEWVSSAMLGMLAIAIFIGMFNKKVLSWASLAGGMIWVAVAAGTLHDNIDSHLTFNTKAALFLLPIGIALAHLSLERYVERPKNQRAIDRPQG